MPEDARAAFAKNFSFLLDQRGKTQIDVSRDLDVATGTVSSWANGLKYPRVDKMQRLADYLGVRMSILVEENGIDVFKREEDENRLLTAYRAASREARGYAMDILEKSAAERKEKGDEPSSARMA